MIGISAERNKEQITHRHLSGGISQKCVIFRLPAWLNQMAGTLLVLLAMAHFSYQRRQPEKTLLYRVIRENLATFLDRTEQSGGTLPWFVRREFREFSRCGVLADGFARFECRSCRTNLVVAFSCKRRGFCPSCGGRRMTERAAHLVDSVLPSVPIRQWVLSVPMRVRYLIAYNANLCSLMVEIFTREVFRWYRRRGKNNLHENVLKRLLDFNYFLLNSYKAYSWFVSVSDICKTSSFIFFIYSQFSVFYNYY